MNCMLFIIELKQWNSLASLKARTETMEFPGITEGSSAASLVPGFTPKK